MYFGKNSIIVIDSTFFFSIWGEYLEGFRKNGWSYLIGLALFLRLFWRISSSGMGEKKVRIFQLFPLLLLYPDWNLLQPIGDRRKRRKPLEMERAYHVKLRFWWFCPDHPRPLRRTKLLQKLSWRLSAWLSVWFHIDSLLSYDTFLVNNKDVKSQEYETVARKKSLGTVLLRLHSST